MKHWNCLQVPCWIMFRYVEVEWSWNKMETVDNPFVHSFISQMGLTFKFVSWVERTRWQLQELVQESGLCASL